jgi:transcriptional regulator with XRE-family HTH domain
MMSISEKLKKARSATDFTQEMIAEKTGVSRQTMSNWENGKSYPDIASVITLSNVYGITIDSLLKGDSAMIKHLKESTDVTKSNKQVAASLTALAVFLLGNIFMMWVSSGGNIVNVLFFINVPSLIPIFIPLLAVLIFTRSFKLFFGGLRAAISKKETTEEFRAQAASLFRLLSKTAMLAAGISIIMGIISMPLDFIREADIADMVAIIGNILIAPLYSLFMIAFLLEPIVFILKKD